MELGPGGEGGQASTFQVEPAPQGDPALMRVSAGQPGMLLLEGPKQRRLEAGVTLDRGGSGHLGDKSRISPQPGFCSAPVTS